MAGRNRTKRAVTHHVAETNRKRHGKDFYAKIGQKGGRNGNTGGFAADHDRARVAGAKGGRNSRRGPALRDEKGRAITKDGRLYARKKKKTVNRRIEEPAAQEGFFYRLFRRKR